ncbi:hypothetical protein HAX54_051838 [Datura stramonium]|uniref:Uncharacterized protein n=1 Tax=Datura stramonium TaxID=4076 RepID=A0ABS8T095_DATST|nr:hypothetical protein [Datura stramonium]
MTGWGHDRITQSRSFESRAKGQCRRARHRRTHFRGREIIKGWYPKRETKSIEESKSYTKGKREKLRVFKSFKMSPSISIAEFIHLFELKCVELKNYIELSDWEALANLGDSLRGTWGDRLTNVYHEV